MKKNSYYEINLMPRMFFLALGLLFFAACNNKPKEVLAENEFYVCSMDPQVLEKQSGICPICKMPLTKTVIDKTQMKIVKLNAEQIRLANIKVDTLQMTAIGKETVLNGVFAVNQDKTEQLSARIDGRIEKLYYKIAGEVVKPGFPAFDLYSIPLKQAQDEYLLALEKSNRIGGESFVTASKNKLLLWGLNEKQITELETTRQSKVVSTIYFSSGGTVIEIQQKEGDVVSEGMGIYRIADLSTVWVEAQVYSNELGILEEGKKVEVVPESFPEEVFEGTITFSNPEVRPNTRTSIVRIEVKNPDGKFKPGMLASVIHRTDEKEAIVLPIDAVIRDSKRSVVWVQNKEGGFESRVVETGIENKFRVEIRSGLSEGDIVAVSGAYLINSEYVFKTGMMPMEEMKTDHSTGLGTDSVHTNKK
jgi:membrane fusion protein, copper/silver efflux system